MLFNSYEFVLFFLPFVVSLYYLLRRFGWFETSVGFLVLASLFFYGWWNPVYLYLIGLSILVNFALGVFLGKRGQTRLTRSVLILGVVFNLGLLGYFKYANFVVGNLNEHLGAGFNWEYVVLPLAISFFTFQQIAYLVDAYRDESHEYSFIHYCLFVTFFPQLIAGPIVHHKEMLPQFANPVRGHFLDNFSIGMTIFTIGLFKKVVLADNVAVFVSPVFAATHGGEVVAPAEAWLGLFGYACQLYFDFSGYADMAIGAGRMFGIRLPLNFHSPYKSRNYTELWRDWHMTLSRFLRDYVYIALGGSRKGKVRQYVNLFLTMFVAGVWHGAGWTFIVWGVYIGLMVVISHYWRTLCEDGTLPNVTFPWHSGKLLAWFLTVGSFISSMVLFRSESLSGAGNLTLSLLGMADVTRVVIDVTDAREWVLPLFLLALIAPNTQEIMSRFEPASNSDKIKPKWSLVNYRWQPGWGMAGVTLAALLYCLISMTNISEFLYFQF